MVYIYAYIYSDLLFNILGLGMPKEIMKAGKKTSLQPKKTEFGEMCSPALTKKKIE